MKIRSCFVSNSSTSSFIISLPIRDLPIESRVNTPDLDHTIEFYSYNGSPEVNEKLKEKYEYLRIAKEENCYITEVEVEGWESPDDISICLSDIPNYRILRGSEK